MWQLIPHGMVPFTEKIEEIIHLTDLFLLDIKHIHPEKCKNLVSFSNEKELAFAKKLSDMGKPMWIRQVIIPSITDNEEDLKMLKDFLSSLKHCLQFLFLLSDNIFLWHDSHQHIIDWSST